MKHFFATFGYGHPFGSHVVVLKAKTEEKAREAMFEIFGKNWAFLYEQKFKKGAIDSHDYSYLCELEVRGKPDDLYIELVQLQPEESEMDLC